MQPEGKLTAGEGPGTPPPGTRDGLPAAGAFRSIASAIAEFRARNRGRSLRQKVHALMFADSHGGGLNIAVELFLIFWILASVVSIVCESVDSLQGRFGLLFRAVDIASFVVFGIEYALRIYASPEHEPGRPAWRMRWRFLTSWQGLLDLAAILPFMLDLIFSGFLDLRFLRIVRMVRLLKLSRYSSANDTMFAVLKKEAPILLASSLVMCLLVFIMAALGYLLERGAQPDKFENIPQAIYWAVVTLASVGYGDISPVTPAGRFMTVVLALVGIGIFSIPAAVLASGFTEQLRLNREKLRQDLLADAGDVDLTEANRARLRGHWRSLHLSEVEIREMFEEIEFGRRNDAADGSDGWSAELVSANSAYALARYRAALSQLQQVAALADRAGIDQALQTPGAATDIERRIWQELTAHHPSSGPAAR